MCVSEYVCTPHVCLESEEGRRELWSPWTGRYGGDSRHVGAGPFVRAGMLFTISPALMDGFLFLIVSEMAIFHTSGYVIKNTNAIYCC